MCRMLPLTDATAALQARTLADWKKASAMCFPIQIKFPYMSEFMFGSEHSESKLRGAARFNYRVVLANGLAELRPGSFELKFRRKIL